MKTVGGGGSGGGGDGGDGDGDGDYPRGNQLIQQLSVLKSWVCADVLPSINMVSVCTLFGVIGERQEAQILKFNAPPPPPPPSHSVCHVHLIANFLSFHMSLVVVVNCGAGNALRGFEISMF